MTVTQAFDVEVSQEKTWTIVVGDKKVQCDVGPNLFSGEPMEYWRILTTGGGGVVSFSNRAEVRDTIRALSQLLEVVDAEAKA